MMKASLGTRLGPVVDVHQAPFFSGRGMTRRSGRDRRMLTYLGQLGEDIQVFNVFRYITFRTGAATMTALLFVFLFGPGIIEALKLRQGKGQPIRADGPQTHLAKAGTPTMGGLMILSGVLVSTLLWANLSNVYVWAVLLVTTGFGGDRPLRRLSEGDEGDASTAFPGRARLGLEARHRGDRRAHHDRLRRLRSCTPRSRRPSSRTRRSTSATSMSSSARS